MKNTNTNTETKQTTQLLNLSHDQETAAAAVLGQDQDNAPEESEAEQDQERTQAEVYQDQIYFLVDDFNEREYPNKTEEELKENRAYFPQLIRYIYNNYVKGLLHTDTTKRSYKENKYNIEQLDYIFNIYLSLVYKYKFNNRPTITEFSLLVGIHKETIYNWGAGVNVNSSATPEYTVTVKNWLSACEQALIDGNGEYIKEIFLLKSCHGFRDQDNTITVKHEVLPTLTADELPQVLGIAGKSS